MKKTTPIMISITFFMCLMVGCENSKQVTHEGVEKINLEQINDVREIAWNHLSQSQKSHVVGSWKKAKVTKLVMNNGVLQGTPYDGKEVYLVGFPSDENPSIGGIGVYISTDTKMFIKFAPRD